jgi:2,5-diketo-D-gluconate reductase A
MGSRMTPYPAASLPGGGATPLFGFGTWQITGEQCYDAVGRALDVGYRHLDTAAVYGTEARGGWATGIRSTASS